MTVEQEVPMLSELIPPERAWMGSTLIPEQYVMKIPAECLIELKDVVSELSAAPVPTLLLMPEQFRLQACVGWMKSVRREMDDGLGFVVVDRLPLNEMTEQNAIDLYWLLGNMIEPPVAQEWKGTPIIHLRAEAKEEKHGIRGTVTSDAAAAHTDSSMGEAPPHYLGLLCLRNAKSGGVSSCVSVLAAHNHFMKSAPDLLRRLYRPYYRDVKTYQAPDAAEKNFHPIFAWEGWRLRTRLSIAYVVQGYERTGRALDEEGRKALDALGKFLSDPVNVVNFMLEPGQILFNNNNTIAHGRSAFEDYPEPERQRYLVRLWMRAGDRRQFRG
jgi:alpha-ketoglutarate-dependent taurine dioxygenase